MKFVVAGKDVSVSAKDAIGKGGEADVYALGNGTALKVFKLPGDPDYVNDPVAQEGARLRLVEQQAKLPAFPQLPPSVVAPVDLAYNGTGKVAGYTMEYLKGWEVLLRYGDRRFREQGGIGPNDVVGTFDALYEAVQALHIADTQRGDRVVIGDFNDLNVLVKDGEVRLIDADSFQFGNFVSHTFTARFLDPLISAPDRLVMVKRPGVLTDWYAYAVMLFQSLLYVGPYGGVHRPKTGPRLQHDQRVLRRVTVFGPDVIYPKPAIPYDRLPDELLDYFHDVFEKDERKPFDVGILDTVNWTKCATCGTEHARPVCPACATYVKREPVVVRGNVKAQRVFFTEGQIVAAVHQRRLRYLWHNGHEFIREDGSVVTKGPLHPDLRYRIWGNQTAIARRNRMLVFPGAVRTDVDCYGHLPVADASSHGLYWVDPAGQLQFIGPPNDRRVFVGHIGDVLPGRTLFWVGEKFGFGFYRIGTLMRAFVFTDKDLNDRVDIPDFKGELVDTTCVFSDARAWFFATLQDKGRLINHVYVLDAAGNLLGRHRAVEQTADDWLAAGIRGRFATGKVLYVPTADGIVQIEEGDLDRPAREYRDTEPFVDETSYLLAGDGGIYVVGTRDITLLTMD